MLSCAVVAAHGILLSDMQAPLCAGPVDGCTASDDSSTLLILAPGAFCQAEEYRQLAVALQVVDGTAAPSLSLSALTIPEAGLLVLLHRLNMITGCAGCDVGRRITPAAHDPAAGRFYDRGTRNCR